MTLTVRRSTRQHKSTKKDPDFHYPDLQHQMSDWRFPAGDSAELFTNHSPNTEATSPLQAPLQAPKDPSSPSKPSKQQQPDLSARDLSQEIKLVQVQKDKLALELEALRLRHAPSSSHHDTEPSTSTPPNSTKKRTIGFVSRL